MAKSLVLRQEDDDDLVLIPIEEVEHSDAWCIYGRSGTGKTTLAASFPKPLLLVDIMDKGTRSIATVKGITVLRIRRLEQVEKLYFALLKERQYAGFKTIVFDTVTQLQDIAGRVCFAKQLGIDPDSDDPRLDRWGDWGNLTLKGWGNLGALMKDLIANFRDLEGRRIVFLAQERQTETDDEEIRTSVGPALTPAAANVLNANVDYILHQFINTRTVEKEVKGKVTKDKITSYYTHVGPNPVYVTKVRKPKAIRLPSHIEDADFETLTDTFKGE